MSEPQISPQFPVFSQQLWTVFGSSLLSLGLSQLSVSAQSITEANDGTGTIIHSQGDEYLITGGSQAGNNLFHSFEQFGLNSGQIANFIGTPELGNILGRVTGGDISVINGLLQVSNSNANLYLMNPAGLIFGPDAQLDLSGSFTATTATGIGFENDWFNSTGANHYANLVGNPTQFYFGATEPVTTGDLPAGSIFNVGNLAVASGQDLALLGRTVINTGNLSAPMGEIAVVAVAGEESQVLRYRQPGMILELELLSLGNNDAPLALPNIKPTDLPAYLTGGDPASSLVVSSDGTVAIAGTEVPIESGTVMVSGEIDVSSATDLGGNVLVTGDVVGLLDAQIDGSGLTGGGKIRIGGDYQGAGHLPTATVTFVDKQTAIAADALSMGDAGEIIVWADDTTRFYGTATAKGGSQGGDGGLVETSGKIFLDVEGAIVDTTAPFGNTGTWLLDPSDLTIGTFDTNITGSPNFSTTGTPAFLSNTTLQNALLTNNVTVTTASVFTGSGDLTLDANINSTSGNNLTLTSRGFINTSLWQISLGSGNLTFNINSVNPGTASAALLGQSIQDAHDAIGTVTGTKTINLGAGTFQRGQAIDLTKELTVNGAGVGATILEGSIFNPLLGTIDDRAVKINPSANVTIANVTIQGGNALASGGGGLYNSGSLILNSSEVRNNYSAYYGGGLTNSGTAIITNSTFSGNTTPKAGAIYNAGDLTLNNVTVTGNTSTSTNGGGLTNNAAGTATIIDSTFSSNNSASRGGAIANYGSSLSLTNSTITGNTAINEGGGIFNQNGATTLSNSNISGNSSSSSGGGISNLFGTLTLNNSIVSGNTASGSPNQGGGGIFNYAGTLTLNNSTVSGNIASGSVNSSGGGILSTTNFNGTTRSTVTLVNSTISGNTAARGGGIDLRRISDLTLNGSLISSNTANSYGGGIALSNGSTANIYNSTISGNNANGPGGGGGIFVGGSTSLNVVNATIANNNDPVYGGGGIRNVGSGNAVITNSIIANNSTNDVVGSFTFSGTNIIADSSATAANILNVDPRLQPLGDYGGPTQTHFFFMDSPAINAGDDSFVTTSIDQRGGDRQVGVVDLGAVEFQGTNLTLVSGDGQNTLVNTPFAPLVLNAREAIFDNVLPNLVVNFSAPSSGASLNPATFFAVTSGTGQVSISPVANALDGTFSVIATALNASVDVPFTLTNLAEVTEEPPSEPEEPLPEVQPEAEEQILDLDQCPPECDDQEESSPDSENVTAEENEIVVEDIQGTLKAIAAQTNVQPALIYALFVPRSEEATTENPEIKNLRKRDNRLKQRGNSRFGETQWEFRGDRLTDFLNTATENFLNPRQNLREDDELELVLITSTGNTIRRRVPEATRAKVMQQSRSFVRSVTNPNLHTSYLKSAQYLYDILVRPLEAELQQYQIENLTYVMDDGLRTLPIAALHDGEKFIIEKYSVGLMPSFSLTNTSSYVEPKQNLLLAMGASKFSDEADLPAAPLEAQIIQNIWQTQGSEASDVFIDSQFTVDNFLAARQKKPYGILHLATHGEFSAGNQANSYIRFADQRVAMNELDRLQLGNPPLELLVLSACRTAIGDRQAELGFAGLALASGAKSVIGSIWYVSDAGTMGLMTRLYEELQTSSTKAEALRQAQLALLRGEVRQEGDQIITRGRPIPLPDGDGLDLALSHPFYWSGFALVGNPW